MPHLPPRKFPATLYMYTCIVHMYIHFNAMCTCSCVVRGSCLNWKAMPNKLKSLRRLVTYKKYRDTSRKDRHYEPNLKKHKPK